MGMFTGIDISASALVAERLRLETITNNVANAESLSEDGARLRPYRRRTPVFYTGDPAGTGSAQLGVRFAGVLQSEKFIPRDSPDPENDPNAVRAEDVQRNPALAPYIGKNLFPDINMATEMADMISASRAYEANVTAMQLSRTMIQSTLQVMG
ncbi:MAG TPA: flagellar basal body rod C-terminal domain-containing protein [Planctomycetota bacterium]|nr:flagellar basal body rod C-terminal domain-containing protein [Planctomycetota bacterium]